MRPLIRSLFLLSLAAAPLASAGPKPQSSTTEATPAYSATSDSAADAAKLSPSEAAVIRVQVQELEAALNATRRELARLREEEDARVRVIGDPNSHPLWP